MGCFKLSKHIYIMLLSHLLYTNLATSVKKFYQQYGFLKAVNDWNLSKSKSRYWK